MNSMYFVYWLQGFFELEKPKKITKIQKEMIQEHIRIVPVGRSPFIEWLNGFLEGIDSDEIKGKKLILIKSKLEAQFEKVTPNPIDVEKMIFEKAMPGMLIKTSKEDFSPFKVIC